MNPRSIADLARAKANSSYSERNHNEWLELAAKADSEADRQVRQITWLLWFIMLCVAGLLLSIPVILILN